MSPKTATAIDAYVAGRLRFFRRERGMSQTEIAKELGVTFQQIQKYEAGLNRIGAGRLFQFAESYGISVQDLYPNSVIPATTPERTEKIDEITNFAMTSDGWKLCESFLRIKEPRQRRIVLTLVQEMAED